MQTLVDKILEIGTNRDYLSKHGMAELNSDIDLPLDICDWVSPAIVKSWLQEEALTLNGSPAATESSKSLLVVLAFAYARGIFDSEEILGLCESEPTFQSLANGQTFSLEQLLGVRRKDRGLLVTLTVRLLSRALAQKLNLSVASLPAAFKRRLHENAVDRLDNARHMDRGEEA